jgi:hypothetical protein
MLFLVGCAGSEDDPTNGVPPEEALLQREASTLDELEQQVQLQLQRHPGGRRVGPNEVAYDGGKFVITFAVPGKTFHGLADCPGGWFCFYQNYNYGYPRGKLSDCTWQDLAWWGWNDRTRAVHNNTASEVDFIQHWDMGNPANGHSYDYDLWTTEPRQAIPRVASPAMADHVNRHLASGFCPDR